MNVNTLRFSSERLITSVPLIQLTCEKFFQTRDSVLTTIITKNRLTIKNMTERPYITNTVVKYGGYNLLAKIKPSC